MEEGKGAAFGGSAGRHRVRARVKLRDIKHKEFGATNLIVFDPLTFVH